MTFAERMIGIAVLALPSTTRDRHWEQWLADLRDAPQLGLSRGQIVRGAFRFSARELWRAVTGAALRDSFSWWQLVAVLALVGMVLYVVYPEDALLGGREVALRDQFDLFSEFMNTPFTLLMPVIVVLLACTRFARDRLSQASGSRRKPRRFESQVVAKLLVGCGGAFLVFFAWTLLAFTIAFAFWPAIGNPSVHPHDYALTAVSAVADSLHRTTYSQLLAAGPWAYGVAYSAWVGFCAALYAALGAAALLVIRNRGIALLAPFVLYFGETVVAQLLGFPSAALSFSVFPFGLTQQSVIAGAAPTIILAALAVTLWVLLLRRQTRQPDFA